MNSPVLSILRFWSFCAFGGLGHNVGRIFYHKQCAYHVYSEVNSLLEISDVRLLMYKYRLNVCLFQTFP